MLGNWVAAPLERPSLEAAAPERAPHEAARLLPVRPLGAERRGTGGAQRPGRC
ncbi:hypothetical protein PVAP13_1NG535600 [Panicum virgatum]|uniref:Uncharacterized protein n=1 Tax=Panicum virgatum TaxID=38727 RepID=A0A8T0X9A0_PANVG|nr:hypothetical protein PVAP13_1NG535600 [Panicum virgatum]